jgi:two-component sensor histidine kinase
MPNASRFTALQLRPPKNARAIPPKRDESFLLREMHHRFGNTLTALVSRLRQDFATFALPEIQGVVNRYESRLVAFGNLHRCLVIGGTDVWVSVPNYIQRLSKALLEAVLEPLGVRVEVKVHDGELPSETCELVGLLISELVINSAKHAFHGRQSGLVRIELVETAGEWFCAVSDNGNGAGESVPGGGSEIIGRLVQMLGGSITKKSTVSGTALLVTWPSCDMKSTDSGGSRGQPPSAPKSAKQITFGRTSRRDGVRERFDKH